MKISKTRLLEALLKVRPGLSERPLVEQTDHFIFDERGSIWTYNDEIAVSFPFGSDFTAAVKAEEFFCLISKIESEQVVLSLGKDGTLSIIAGKMKGEMATAVEIKCPAVTIKAKRWLSLPKNFVAAVSFCLFSAEHQNAISVLTYLLVKGGFICSSDRYRASKYKMDGSVQEFLLHIGAARELVRCEPIYYIVDGDSPWVNFKNKEGVIFSSRVFDGKYPEEIWEVFNRKKGEGDIVTVPEGLVNAVECGKIFSRDTLGESEMVLIKVASGKMICRGQGPLGYVEQEFDIGYKKRDFGFSASADALAEILSRVKEMRVLKDKLYFEGADFEHVISLV